MTELIKGFIPILNPGKCGSSWLAQALTIRPFIAFPREFDFIYFLRYSSNNQWNKETSENDKYLRIKNSDLTETEKLLRLYTLERNLYDKRTLLIDKAPSNIYSGFIDFRHLFKNLKIIVLYRDPRDIYISNEFFHQNQLHKKVKKEDIGQINYIKNNAAYNFAFNNTTKLRVLENVLKIEGFEYIRITYEEMKSDFGEVLMDIFSFIKLNIDQDTVVKSNYINEPIKLKNHINEAENFKPLFRKGIVGDWRNYLKSKETKDFIKENHGDLLIDLGYESNYEW
jgi:hypothetical protein